MDWTSRRKRFRSVLTGSRCIFPASVFDPISARIAEDLGFEVGMFAGSVASLAVLGAPDIVLLSSTEFVQQAYRIGRASSLPLLVDADHGYGNALNVQCTVQELENAGVSALTIEDTLLPRPYGAAKSQLISIEEGVGKLRAAVAGREDPGLALIARTNVALAGLDGAVARARAYARTGVDALFLTRVKTRQELEALASSVDLPIVLGSVTAELSDATYLAERGVRVCLQGHKPFMAAVQAVYDTLKALRQGVPADMPATASSELIAQLSREEALKSSAREFLGGT
jgi:oxaloacetate decarboxylase